MTTGSRNRDLFHEINIETDIFKMRINSKLYEAGHLFFECANFIDKKLLFEEENIMSFCSLFNEFLHMQRKDSFVH